MKTGLMGLLFPMMFDKVVYGYNLKALPDIDIADFKRKHKKEKGLHTKHVLDTCSIALMCSYGSLWVHVAQGSCHYF